ncbi:MAG TPA: YoaK family protein [Candidatus Angelobacter sp.]
MNGPATASRATVLLFTGVAGSVDAITYLTAHVFTANMTGNAVLLGIAAGQGNGKAAVSSLVALVAFVGGVVLGAGIVGEGDAASAPADVRRAVWLETFILAIFVVVCFAPLPLPGRVTVLLLIVSSGLAMGLQSAAVRRLKLPGIATTYITGTITILFSGLVHHWRPARAGGGATPADANVGFTPVSQKHSLVLQAEVFFSYTIAALACAAFHTYWPSGIAVLPWLALIAVDVSLARHRRADS